MFCLGCPHRCKGIYDVTALEHFSKATGSLPLGRGEGLTVLARSQSGGFGFTLELRCCVNTSSFVLSWLVDVVSAASRRSEDLGGSISRTLFGHEKTWFDEGYWRLR